MMSKQPKQTAAADPRRFPRPTAGQIFRQLGTVLIVMLVWSALLVGFLQLGNRPTATAVLPSPTGTDANTPPPIDMASAATEPAATATETELAAEATALSAATDEPAPTDTAEPTATETQIPPTNTPEAETAADVSFAADVLPVFESRCLQCHGPSRVEGGLRLDSYANLMTGGDEGPSVVPGDATASLLVSLVESGEMPRRGPRLTTVEIQTIRDWIDAGALEG
jgi:mono/diheme cytochrome c family protein